MLFIPTKIPLVTFPDDVLSPFDQEIISEDPELTQNLTEISASRQKFQKWIQNAKNNALANKEEFLHNMDPILHYLDHATNWMDLVCKFAVNPFDITLTSILASPESHEPFSITISGDHELLATAEIIIARLGLVTALLQNIQTSYKELPKLALEASPNFKKKLQHC